MLWQQFDLGGWWFFVTFVGFAALWAVMLAVVDYVTQAAPAARRQPLPSATLGGRRYARG